MAAIHETQRNRNPTEYLSFENVQRQSTCVTDAAF